VIAEAIRRSALADYADRFAARSAASKGTLAIREVPFLTQINLRVSPSEAGPMAAMARELGFALPVDPNSVSGGGDRWCLWLGPDEWLIIGLQNQRQAIDAIRTALGGTFGSVTEVSANRTVIEIGGSTAPDLLAQGCSVDLHKNRFMPGQCVQTLLARAGVLIHLVDGTPTFRLYVRTSFAGYLADWLLDAAAGD
jgi:sarcosine oxidase subunit gamma